MNKEIPSNGLHGLRKGARLRIGAITYQGQFQFAIRLEQDITGDNPYEVGASS